MRLKVACPTIEDGEYLMKLAKRQGYTDDSSVTFDNSQKKLILIWDDNYDNRIRYGFSVVYKGSPAEEHDFATHNITFSMAIEFLFKSPANKIKSFKSSTGQNVDVYCNGEVVYGCTKVNSCDVKKIVESLRELNVAF